MRRSLCVTRRNSLVVFALGFLAAIGLAIAAIDPGHGSPAAVAFAAVSDPSGTEETTETNDKESYEALLAEGQALCESRSFKEALEPLTRAAKIGPDSVELHTYLAIAKAGSGDISGAKKDVAWLEAHGGAPAQVYLVLGNAYYNLYGKFDRALPHEALQQYEKAVRLDPNLGEAYLGLGLALSELGHIKEAEAALQRACKLGFGNSKVYLSLGFIYESLGRIDDAIHYALLTIEKEPSESAFMLLGALYASKGDFQAAARAYERVTILMPGYSVGYFKLGQARYEAGDLDGAVSALLKSIEISPYNAYAHYALGLAYQGKGDLDRAKGAFDAAILRNPTYVSAYLGRAKLEEAMGDTDAAIETYQKILEIAPLEATAHFGLGMLYKATGNKEGAVAELRRCLHIDSSYPKAREILDELLGRK